MNSHPKFVGYDAIEGKPNGLSHRFAAPQTSVERDWRFPSGLKQLEAFLGARGVLTGQIHTEAMALDTANTLYGLNANSLGQALVEISILSKAERRRRCLANLNALPSSLISSRI